MDNFLPLLRDSFTNMMLITAFCSAFVQPVGCKKSNEEVGSLSLGPEHSVGFEPTTLQFLCNA